MRWFVLMILISLLLCLVPRAMAVGMHPPSVVINFAAINELSWSAPEEEWQRMVKPVILKEIRSMRSALQSVPLEPLATSSQSHVTPVLAWSTLLEYMNYPLDDPSDQSPYVIKVRRILEISREERLPVFLPLNGFQWWDELPELYNWWDPDGSQTDPAFFARQDNPEDFKRRFVAGYDPANRWNVEWQSPKTPMKLSYRNWGGGGFRLAPPPNLLPHTRSIRSYRQIQEERLGAIGKAIIAELTTWKEDPSAPLFLGVSIGTEVSLNASVLPRDEFAPYGFRGMQDLLCPSDDSCLSLQASESAEQVRRQSARIEVVRRYFEDNARLLLRIGLQKSQIYTHVLGEQDPSDPHFGGVATAATTLYANPGVSLYGFAKNPEDSQSWQRALESTAYPVWGALEYNAGTDAKAWTTGLRSTLLGKNPAAITVIYNWDGLSSEAIPAIRSFLREEVSVPLCPITNQTTLVNRGVLARLGESLVASDPSRLSHGIYTKVEQSTDCVGRIRYGTPETFYVPLPAVRDDTPLWVRWVLRLLAST